MAGEAEKSQEFALDADAPVVTGPEAEAEAGDPRVIAFLMRHAGRGDIIHSGIFPGGALVPLSAGLAETATLWVFQPDPDTHRAVGQAITDDRLWNVSLRRAVPSSEPGRVFLPSAGLDTGPGAFVPADFNARETVETLRLDDAIPGNRKVSVMLLEGNGHQVQALIGARRLIARCRPVLVISAFRRPRWFAKNFGALGYRVRGRLRDKLVISVDPVDF
ncbi:hypothetical protein [Pseudooceanicola sp.]|uniref:hypothetical protein n=1 Tax=Pseudooceanicola sp. TaxID=1914328 RepID=UPI0026057332|nr:hypothetical protein [Pseudooceanicola sp.]MDF1854924.1 hypothetical protein [Pseudooceanicola sp.]